MAAVKYGGPWEKRGMEFTLQCEGKMGLYGGGAPREGLGGQPAHFKEPFQTRAFGLLKYTPTDQKFLIHISRKL